MQTPSTRYALSGQNALVTGGSRSIGRSIALGLARSGANVVVNYKQAADAAARTVAEIQGFGRKGVAIRADVSDPVAVERMLDEAESAVGRLDILVNNAGILRRTPFLEIPLPEWDMILATNLRGCFVVGQAVARRMVKHGIHGRIVNVCSDSAKDAARLLTHYCVAKAGLSMLTKQMALELAEHGINVNEVNPGLIETDMNRKDLQNESFRQFRLSLIPLRRIGAPDDVVGAVLFLASEDARLMTGASVFVDGGATIL